MIMQIELPILYPDAQRPGLHYLATEDNPTICRSVDVLHPRLQLRVIFREENLFLIILTTSQNFSQKYVVTEDAIKMYVNRLKLLSLRKEKKDQKKRPRNVKKKLERHTKTMTGKKCFMRGVFHN